MIAIIHVLREAQKLRKRAKALYAMAFFLKMRLYLRDRHFLKAKALLTTVIKEPWYTLYTKGCDSDFISTVSLTRESFEILLSRFKNFYIFKSGPTKSGRPPRVRDHHCVLSLLLHSYCSPVKKKKPQIEMKDTGEGWQFQRVDYVRLDWLKHSKNECWPTAN